MSLQKLFVFQSEFFPPIDFHLSLTAQRRFTHSLVFRFPMRLLHEYSVVLSYYVAEGETYFTIPFPPTTISLLKNKKIWLFKNVSTVQETAILLNTKN